MKEIIEQLKEFADNIEHDISSDWIEDVAMREYMLQALKLRQAIGILESVGKNDNI